MVGLYEWNMVLSKNVNRRRFSFSLAAGLVGVTGLCAVLGVANNYLPSSNHRLTESQKMSLERRLSLAEESDLEEQKLRERIDERLGNVKNPISINNMAQLGNIGYDESYLLSADYVLTRDIDCKGNQLGQIGDKDNPFTGTFNGDGKRISNFTLGSKGEYDVSLFYGLSKDSVVGNVVFADSKVNGDSFISTLAQYNEGSVYQCGLENMTINGIGNVSGLVALNREGDIVDCYSNNKTLVVSSKKPNAGGLIGSISGGRVIDCYVKGTVEGTTRVGGIVATAGRGEIKNCYLLGNVFGSTLESDVGSIIGSATGTLILNNKPNSSLVFPDGSNSDSGPIIGYAVDTTIIGYPGRKTNELVKLPVNVSHRLISK
tara:strand:+ start:246 stop:1367 length:1122 start_codon:yes stop_codon:yes gene_type:complete